MKAYYVWEHGCEGEAVDVVFAQNHREARKEAFHRSYVIHDSGCSFFEVRARRAPHLDWWARLAGKPGAWDEFFEGDPCFIREAFVSWTCPNTRKPCPTCAGCGKPDVSSLHPDKEAAKVLHERWEICSECGFCRECGCA